MLAQPTRTAVYGPVRTVVWQGSAGDRRPYADQVRFSECGFLGPYGVKFPHSDNPVYQMG